VRRLQVPRCLRLLEPMPFVGTCMTAQRWMLSTLVVTVSDLRLTRFLNLDIKSRSHIKSQHPMRV
jgi:hypothetical protein